MSSTFYVIRCTFIEYQRLDSELKAESPSNLAVIAKQRVGRLRGAEAISYE